jgi:hypothetical protein
MEDKIGIAEQAVKSFETARDDYAAWLDDVRKTEELAAVLDEEDHHKNRMATLFEEAKLATKGAETSVGEFVYSVQRNRKFRSADFVTYVAKGSADLKSLLIRNFDDLVKLCGGSIEVKVDLDKLKAQLVAYFEDELDTPWPEGHDKLIDKLKERFIGFQIIKKVSGPKVE